MAKIQSEAAYKAEMERMEKLVPLVDDSTPIDYKNFIVWDFLSGFVSDYEDEYYPIKSPLLLYALKLRMYEW